MKRICTRHPARLFRSPPIPSQSTFRIGAAPLFVYNSGMATTARLLTPQQQLSLIVQRIVEASASTKALRVYASFAPIATRATYTLP